jgi:ABC-type bacteriocin/lantibiotic exporters, contain an N-terminal double-glycine peptidase domain
MSFDFVKQPDVSYCGPACLKMVANFYKITLSLESLKKKYFNTKEEVSFLELSEAADSMGFRTIGVKIPFEFLYENVPLPCIVHWRRKHFIIVYKITKDKIWIADPFVGLVKYNRDVFVRSWAYSYAEDKPVGLVLIIEPTPALYLTDHSEAEEIFKSIGINSEPERIYKTSENNKKTQLTVVSINDEIKRYLALHPEKIYSLNPRSFEELIADILHDLGFEVELTKATRDGGVDIYAYVRTTVCNFLVFVECKKWAPDNHVGLDIVQRLFGVQQIGQANKSMIITTSFFTDPAIKEAKRYNGMMDLRDFNSLKDWLIKYKDFDSNNYKF